MTRNEARKIAEIITLDELKKMFSNAKDGIKNWEQRATVNIGMTKGTAFNILSLKKEYANIDEIHILGRTNMIREFGDFLPEHLKPEKKNKRVLPTPVHQEPNFGDIF